MEVHCISFVRGTEILVTTTTVIMIITIKMFLLTYFQIVNKNIIALILYPPLCLVSIFILSSNLQSPHFCGRSMSFPLDLGHSL